MSKTSDKMAAWPIGKLLFSMGLPAVFSMLIQALYNIVDTIFISQYSQDAMFAIGLVYPMQMVIINYLFDDAILVLFLFVSVKKTFFLNVFRSFVDMLKFKSERFG